MKNKELGKIRAKRIKELMAREKITQQKLAEMIGTTQQRLCSNLKNGIITETRVNDIHEVFPQYNLDWLLGHGEFATQRDKNIAVLTRSKNDSNTMLSALIGLAKLSGFKVEVNPNAFGGNVESVFNAVHGNYITFSREGKKVSLSVTDLNRLENKLCDYVEFELIHMCE